MCRAHATGIPYNSTKSIATIKKFTKDKFGRNVMKKKTLFLTLALTMAMSMSALTGCGTKTSATDDAIVEETPTTEDTMKEEVVVAGEDDTSTTEDISNETVSNDDSFVFLQQEDDVNETKTTSYEIPVYCEDGYKVGYIKAGSTFTIIGKGKLCMEQIRKSC